MPAWVLQGDGREVGWRKLVVAQHCGLPTRFLDWTTNPLAALYFAVEEEPLESTEDSAVYVLKDRKAFTVVGMARSPKNGEAPYYAHDEEEVGLLMPPHISPRVSAQGSVFAIRKAPDKPIEPDLIVPVSQDERKHIRRELSALNINRSTLFPDMDGAAEYLEWSCRFWQPDRGVEPAPDP